MKLIDISAPNALSKKEETIFQKDENIEFEKNLDE